MHDIKRKMPKTVYTLVVAGLLLLSSCSLLPSVNEAPTQIQLMPTSPGILAGNRISKKVQLIVAVPQTPRVLYTDAIVCIFNKREVRSLEGHRWTATIPELLQRSLVSALDDTSAFSTVTYEASGLASVYTLQSDVKQFALVYPAEKATPTAVLDITLRMVNVSTGRSMATLPLHIEVLAAGQNPDELAKAFDLAVTEMLAKVCPFAIAAIHS